MKDNGNVRVYCDLDQLPHATLLISCVYACRWLVKWHGGVSLSHSKLSVKIVYNCISTTHTYVTMYTAVIAITLQHCEVRRQCGGAAVQDNKFYYSRCENTKTEYILELW